MEMEVGEFDILLCVRVMTVVRGIHLTNPHFYAKALMVLLFMTFTSFVSVLCTEFKFIGMLFVGLAQISSPQKYGSVTSISFYFASCQPFCRLLNAQFERDD